MIISDGARWIWNTADELFPGAIGIIDVYHAKGTLAQLAKNLFGPVGEQTEQWGKARRDELENGQMQAILGAIDPHQKASKDARTCRECLLANRHRLDYPRFRRMGLCTASGVVEAGCKLAVSTRLKRAGMHWTVDGVNAVMALRACRLSRRYDGYWDRRHAAWPVSRHRRAPVYASLCTSTSVVLLPRMVERVHALEIPNLYLPPPQS